MMSATALYPKPYVQGFPHGNQIYSGTFPYTMGWIRRPAMTTSTDILTSATLKNNDIPTFSASSKNYITEPYVYDASSLS